MDLHLSAMCATYITNATDITSATNATNTIGTTNEARAIGQYL